VIVARSIGELDLPRNGIVGLVPTMGALHAGHTALFEAARPDCDVLVASVFVNPAQFSELTDLSAYPRDLDHDVSFAAEHGVDVVFAPPPGEMYPDGFATWVEPGGAAEGLESADRPGHFRGVATVCLKLFNLVRPQIAWFGRKDAQQVAVVKQLVRDLDLEIEIRVVDTVRDADGLALSSRNAYLSADERRRAVALPRALNAAKEKIRAGLDVSTVLGEAQSDLRHAGFARIDYVALVDCATLEPVKELTADARLIAAAVIGTTRLIDNLPV